MAENQKFFVELLRRFYNSDEGLHTWISNTLDVSRPTAYRILSSESQLNLDQIVILGNKIPGLIQSFAEQTSLIQSQLITFTKHTNEKEFQEVLVKLIQLFKHFKSLDDVMLHYTARDVILFHFLDSFELLNYKFHAWHPEAKNVVISKRTLDLGKELFELYRTIPSREFWLKEAFNAQVKQLRVKMKLRLIDEETGKRIYHSLKQKVLETAQWSETGQKGINGAPVEYRVSDYCMMNNGGVLTANNASILMLAVDNARFINVQSESWIADHLNSFNNSFAAAKPMNHHYPNEIEKFIQAFGEL